MATRALLADIHRWLAIQSGDLADCGADSAMAYAACHER